MKSCVLLELPYQKWKEAISKFSLIKEENSVTGIGS